jgi:hypothetical protein
MALSRQGRRPVRWPHRAPRRHGTGAPSRSRLIVVGDVEAVENRAVRTDHTPRMRLRCPIHPCHRPAWLHPQLRFHSPGGWPGNRRCAGRSLQGARSAWPYRQSPQRRAAGSRGTLMGPHGGKHPKRWPDGYRQSTDTHFRCRPIHGPSGSIHSAGRHLTPPLGRHATISTVSSSTQEAILRGLT